jgi:hypothetical protein
LVVYGINQIRRKLTLEVLLLVLDVVDWVLVEEVVLEVLLEVVSVVDSVLVEVDSELVHVDECRS